MIITKILLKFKRNKPIQQSAFIHNSLKNVDNLNSDSKHFKKNLISDRATIECLYSSIVTLIDDNVSSFLDVGCGSGVLANKIKKDYTNLKVCGCDFSTVKIKQCNDYYKTDLFFTHNLYSDLEKKYDIITCTEVLEHLESPEEALLSICTYLNNNGKLFISVPNGRLDTFEGHIHFWSPESFKLFIYKTIGQHQYNIDFKSKCNKNIVIITKKRNKD